MILAFETLFFGALFFYGELLGSQPSYTEELHFNDILVCFWWALITLTTVGYGDIIPLTTIGQVVAALAAVFGMLTIIVPIPVFLVKFKSYYDIAILNRSWKGARNINSSECLFPFAFSNKPLAWFMPFGGTGVQVFFTAITCCLSIVQNSGEASGCSTWHRTD